MLARLVVTVDSIVALYCRALSPDIPRQFGGSVRWINADITTDDLFSVVRNVDTVFHLAAYSSISESDEEKSKMEKVNVAGTNRLAFACKESGVRHFIFVSSIAACESSESMDIDESNGFPKSTYGKTKKLAEDSLLQMSTNEFSVTVLRPCALFGENHLGSIYELVKVINHGRFVMIGNGKNRINFYYVKDFVEVLLAVDNNARAFGEVFIAGDKPYTLQELIAGIELALGSKHTVHHIPLFLGVAIGKGCDLISELTGKSLPLSERRLRSMIRDVAYCNDKIERVIGVTAKIGLFEGLARTISWYGQAGLL